MRFLPPEEPIDLYKTGFSEDLLEREKTNKMLSQVLDRIEDPLVVALDGRWGTGKSYFLKRWVGAHRLQNEGRALTVYFDAFANDYQSDPLVSLVSVLATRIPKADESKIKTLIGVAGKFVRPVSRIGLALASYGATEALAGLGEAAVGALKSEADKALDDFWSREQGRHAAMIEFQSAIVALTESDNTDDPTPLVIVVDELDRCRPDYALEVLEVIKHFFAVPHVHFVLGVNLEALENSVKAQYGAGIDASAYLQKFLSFTVSLPETMADYRRTPVAVTYANHAGNKMGIPNQLQTEISTQIEVLSRCNNISIRDVGKILSAAALLPDRARSDRLLKGWRTTLVCLLITKVIRPDLYPKLQNASLSQRELKEYFCANTAAITRYLETGDPNQDFDSDIYNLFITWSYICSGGVPAEKYEKLGIAGAFDGYGMGYDIKDIPNSAHEKWLSVFQLPS